MSVIELRLKGKIMKYIEKRFSVQDVKSSVIQRKFLFGQQCLL